VAIEPLTHIGLLLILIFVVIGIGINLEASLLDAENGQHYRGDHDLDGWRSPYSAGGTLMLLNTGICGDAKLQQAGTCPCLGPDDAIALAVGDPKGRAPERSF
jgi:hypothetical protein